MPEISPFIKAPNWKRGDAITAAKLQSISDQIDRISNIGYRSHAAQNNAPPLRVQRMEIVEVRKDYIMCAPLTGGDPLSSAGEALVPVAKDYLMRGSITERLLSSGPQEYEYTNSTFTRRTVTAGSTTETQEVYPEYVPQDEIMALYYPDGFGIEDPDDDDAINVVWLDLSARVWVEVTA